MPTISASVAQHLNYRLAVGLSKGTVLNNQVALNSFVAVVGDMQCKSLKPEHFDKWFATRLAQVSPATTNQNFASIKVWVQWAQRYGHLSATVPYTAGVRRCTSPRATRSAFPSTSSRTCSTPRPTPWLGCSSLPACTCSSARARP